MHPDVFLRGIPIASYFVQTLKYEEEFIDEVFEQQLINLVNELVSLKRGRGKGKGKGKRKGWGFREDLQYGLLYDFSAYKVLPLVPLTDSLPALFGRLYELIHARTGVPPTQLLVNVYKPGQGIRSHVDNCNLGDRVIGVTVGSGTDMVFEEHESIPFDHQGAGTLGRETGRRFTVRLAPRSIYEFSNNLRWGWSHQIPPNPSQGARISFTWRIWSPFVDSLSVV